VFDYPDPPDNASDYIAQQLIPDPNGGGVGAVAVTELPVIRFDDLPSRVYVKSIFLDNPALNGGVWLGGYDLSNGFVTGLPLTAVDLTPGSASSVDQHLWATRLVRVSMKLATGVTPDDDGIGPAGIGLYDSATPPSNAAAFGFGSAPCVDVSGGNTATVDAVVVGTGDFWISAAVNDFNQTDVWGAGSIVSLSGTQLPGANRIHVSTQYRILQAVQLTTVLPTGAPPPQPYTCTP
jgi:hypothetical protein